MRSIVAFDRPGKDCITDRGEIAPPDGMELARCVAQRGCGTDFVDGFEDVDDDLVW